MAVRSTRFFGPVAAVVGGAYQLVFTVPIGRTPRFSLVTIANTSAGVVVCGLALGLPGLQTRFVWTDVPARSTLEVARGLVLLPLEQLSIRCETSAVAVFSGSGSLLLGAPS